MVKRGAPKTRTYKQSRTACEKFTCIDGPNEGDRLTFHYRPGTSDDSVINEILNTHWYRRQRLGFDVCPGEHWLDLGANIGGFALYCWIHGATATCYEPLTENFDLLTRNFEEVEGFTLIKSAVTHMRSPVLPMFRGNSEADYARYTTVLGRNVAGVECQNTYAPSAFNARKSWDGVKIDIEAAEHGLLDNKMLPRCKKLCMEYHIRKDPNMANFRRRMDFLRTRFKTVHYAPSLDKGYPNDKYPGAFDRMIFCLDPR